VTSQQGPAESVHEGWTIATYAIHKEALRQADARFAEERDRRYTEVNIEREKALKIKEEADKAALGLAREIQTYKDEKANELREQINSERGLYATKEDVQAAIRELSAVVGPLTTYVSSQQGRDKGIGLIIGGIVIVLGMGFTMLSLVAGLVYFIARG
jgi:hypothetical protein